MVYQLLVFFILLVAFFYKQLVKNPDPSLKERDIFLIPTFFALFVVMGFRDVSVGVDTYNYSMIYRDISSKPFWFLLTDYYYESIEIGFVMLAKLSSFILDDYYFFQIVVSFAICFFMYKFIRQNTRDFVTTSIIFMSIGIYLISFNISRQMLAVSIAVNAWNYLKNNDYKRAFIYTSISLLFHISSIVFFLIYIIYYFKYNKKVMASVPLFFILFVFFFQRLMTVISVYIIKYANYYGNNREIQEANMVKILWTVEFLLSLYIFYQKRFNSQEKVISVLCMVYVLTNIIALSFNYFERIGLFFSPFLLLLFGIYGNSIKNVILRKGYYVVINICFLLFFLRAISTPQYIYSFFF